MGNILASFPSSVCFLRILSEVEFHGSVLGPVTHDWERKYLMDRLEAWRSLQLVPVV